MESLYEIIKENNRLFMVHKRSRVAAGEVVLGEDGFYVFFWNPELKGYVNDVDLLEMGRTLFEYNEKMRDSITHYFSKTQH